jgi:RNA polymerase sigma-70 factor (ECF subfamily)
VRMSVTDVVEVNAVTAARDVRSFADEFTAFFDAEYPRLAAYCARLAGNLETGTDIAQEALVRTWSRWMRVSQPRPYAYLVATNLVRDTWRREARDRQVFLELVSDRSRPPPAEHGLRALVDQLPERLRTPVLLHYYADLPLAEVARVMHRPLGSIKSRLSEARARLAKLLEEDA